MGSGMRQSFPAHLLVFLGDCRRLAFNIHFRWVFRFGNWIRVDEPVTSFLKSSKAKVSVQIFLHCGFIWGWFPKCVGSLFVHFISLCRRKKITWNFWAFSYSEKNLPRISKDNFFNNVGKKKDIAVQKTSYLAFLLQALFCKFG